MKNLLQDNMSSVCVCVDACLRLSITANCLTVMFKTFILKAIACDLHFIASAIITTKSIRQMTVRIAATARNRRNLVKSVKKENIDA